MNIRVDSATREQTLAHLNACDLAFVPELSRRVDLSAYADKLFANARRIEAWQGTELVGLIAIYAKTGQDTGFISNVSVLPTLQGNGIASELLERTLELAKELGLRSIALEVHSDNPRALKFYIRRGFQLQPGHAQPLRLALNLDLP